jgi:hypothetical protein
MLQRHRMRGGQKLGEMDSRQDQPWPTACRFPSHLTAASSSFLRGSVPAIQRQAARPREVLHGCRQRSLGNVYHT